MIKKGGLSLWQLCMCLFVCLSIVRMPRRGTDRPDGIYTLCANVEIGDPREVAFQVPGLDSEE
jgi:hypothetical protein